MRRLALIGLALALLAVPTLRAEDSPARVTLEGLRLTWQQYNRCASAALTIQLSYFIPDFLYDTAIAALNPHPDDVSVDLEEMAAYARSLGLGAISRTGGTIDLLRALIGAGYPVLVEAVHYEGPNDWMSHNWVAVGYDDEAGALLAYDPRLGAGDGRGRPVTYADFDADWWPLNRAFLVVYRPEDEDALAELLPDHWDEADAAAQTLSQAKAALEADPADAFAHFNQGTALLALGDAEGAAVSFDAAFAIGLPWRMLWYHFGPFEAYLATDRPADALAHAERVLATTPGVEEAYYYAGRAHAALGDLERARTFYRMAIARHSGYAAPVEALAALDPEDDEE